ncbi:TPA: hypothetical protein ACTPQ1_004749 [Salmonella enterica]
MYTLVEVRNDVWQASVRDEPEWAGIEKDLPGDPDQMLIFLFDHKKKVVRGIFERKQNRWITTLNCICCGLSELNPELFIGYNTRKVHTPILAVCLSPDQRISGMVPSELRLQDASGSSPEGETDIRINTPRIEDALTLLERVAERGLRENVVINNQSGLPLDTVLKFFETQTCHLLESKTYHFKGAL